MTPAPRPAPIAARRASVRPPGPLPLALAALLAAGACRSAHTRPLPIAPVPADASLDALLDDRQLFALRDSIVARGRLDDARADAPDFHAGAVAAVFGLDARATRTLGAYLQAARRGAFGADTVRVADAEELLGDQAARAGRYAEAARRFAGLLAGHARHPDSARVSGWRRGVPLWRALAATPPQRLSLAAPARIPATRDLAGLTTVPVSGSADSAATPFVFDTGAGLSVATASTAAGLGLRLLPDSVAVGSITGGFVRAAIGVAPRLRVGAVELHHVVFLVLPDANLTFADGAYRIHGILGFPVIAALGEIALERDALLVAAAPASAAGREGSAADQLRARNVALDGFAPLVEARFAGRSAAYAFDTGAQTTLLYPPFLARHDSLVRATSEQTTTGIGGAAGSVRVPAFLMRDARLTLGGRELTLPKVEVLPTAPSPRARTVFGNLGMDLLRRAERVTIDLRHHVVRVTP